jgi:hypothetical protein
MYVSFSSWVFCFLRSSSVPHQQDPKSRIQVSFKNTKKQLLAAVAQQQHSCSTVAARQQWAKAALGTAVRQWQPAWLWQLHSSSGKLGPDTSVCSIIYN